MSNKFVGFLETVGKDFEKGLTFAVKEAPAVLNLVGFIYPPAKVVGSLAETGLNLLQNSILSIEQKYSASGVQSGTGIQKAGEVLALSGPAVVALLTAAGVPNVDSAYVSNLVNLIVGLLNVTPPVAAPAA